MQGYYAIAGEVLEGWVNHQPSFVASETKVRAMRGIEVISECEAVGERRRNRLLFTLPLKGFSVRDLALESVIITARNATGDTGVLALDGPTRIELIRDHLGVPVDPMLDINFTFPGNGNTYLGKGWAKAERDFTWAIGDDSFIDLGDPLRPGSYFLRFRCGAFIAPFVPVQSMEISIDGRPIAAFTERERAVKFRQFRIDWEPAEPNAPPTIRFHHPDAARPMDHFDSTDGRRLAFSFRRVTLGLEL